MTDWLVAPELRFKFSSGSGKAIAMYCCDKKGREWGEAIYYTDKELLDLAKRIEQYANLELSTYTL